MLFRDITAVSFENHVKHTNILCGQDAEVYQYVKACGTYSNHWALKG
jgi:hypothetical protein